MEIVTSPSIIARRPVCAAEVYAIADELRRGRTTEFSLPHATAAAEVRLLFYLRQHGAFLRRHGSPQAAAATLMAVVDQLRELCSVPAVAADAGGGGGSSPGAGARGPLQCVLTDDELIQLVDLRVATEVDLYKVVPDIDSRLGGEAKIRPLLALLGQLGN